MSAPESLAELLGADRVFTEDHDLRARARDLSARSLLERRRGIQDPLPACVVRPHDTEEAAALLRWADETGTPIVPFGGGSGVSGGIAPRDGVVVDMSAMDALVDLDEFSLLARVQAGKIGAELEARLRERGLRLGHEPQSVAISTVGGWVATRACGQLSAGHGAIEDLVAALEVVLPGGRVLRSKPVPRRSTGPDLNHVFIGSEGTLGLITEVVLRLTPVPEERSDAAFAVEHMSAGVAACRALARSDLHPVMVRLYDREDAAIAFRNHPAAPASCILLMSFEGRDAAGRASEAGDLVTGDALGDELVGHWWEHRNAAVEEYERIMAGEGILGPHAIVDTMEISGTWSVLRELYHATKDALTPLADIVGCHLSHTYRDGACLYFTMASACEDDDGAAATHEAWWNHGMTACLGAGGSISHHHGVGRLKAPWLSEELQGYFDLLRDLKAALDPNRIMNPGALGL